MATYVLAMPPSTNKLFVCGRDGARRFKTKAYTSWIRGELLALIAQRARPVTDRAAVSITIPKVTRGDADNRIKPVLDLLVRAGILTDDSGKHVGAVSVTFGDVQMLHVEIVPMVTA